MKKLIIILCSLGACLSVAGASAQDSAEPVNVKEIVTTVCTMCHGDDGNKMLTPETPRIGGQKADYLAKALRDYKSGARKNPIMTAVAEPLSDDALEALAEYFYAQKSELRTQ